MRNRLNLWLACAVFAMLFAGCRPGYYRKSADKEVYKVLRAKSVLVTNMEPGFTIEQTNVISLDAFPIATNAPEFLGPARETENGAHVLSLDDALRLAVKFSREYQSRKESLYLEALSLTLSRHRFAPIFSSTIDVAHRVDEITEARDPFDDRLIDSAGSSVGMSWLIRDIGRISTDLTVDALRLVTGDSSVGTSSRLGARFTRPLLRNAGFKAEMEALTQAERDLVYAIRDFVQYRKDFAVRIANRYYEVLGTRDRAANNYLNLQSSRKNAERSRALAQEGRMTQSDLGRLEQQELSAESSWINSIRTYQSTLANYKFLLGLSDSNSIVLDDRELENLRILEPKLDVDDSIEIALAARLDYLNAKDAYEDAVRKVELAENFLKPDVDFSAGVAIEHNPNSRAAIALPDPTRYAWDAGLRIDPGLDRKAERNSYRTTLITRNRAARQLVQLEDGIRLEVQEGWRDLEQAKRNYEIAVIGVQLAERRVEEQNILAELGRAKAQDQVDAQNALIDSKNEQTLALVAHTNNRLRFWNRLGILFIKPDGRWEETNDVETK